MDNVSTTHAAPLSQGFGYGIVLGLGFAFSAGMILTTWLLKKYQNEVQTSEMFSTAGRTVKTGLVASAVVSSWTWAATLLQSSGIAYRYGVSGPFWYASGATVQILLFATLAIELKRKAPNAHTFLEVIRARYGTYTHLTFTVFGLFTNILVTAMLLTGGSAVVTSLTGMHTAAACFLLPVGVVLYTLFGGIKATFLTDYVHTVIILIVIFIFAFTTYATSDILGSPGKVYDLLVEASKLHPVEGNAGGSYLTMRSTEGVMFFIINIVGNFGTVFCDNGYYNKAIAASPVSALPGYVFGGLSWFAIPWLAATTMGLACVALEGHPSFPGYPARMLDSDVSAGLVLPNASVALLGKGGAACTLLLIFMAVTSASSAELIAVSSIFTYDIYQTYFDPKASGKRLIYMSHVCVVAFGTVMAGFATGLYYIGISMGYLYLLMGVIVSSAVLPAALTLIWKGQNMYAATLSPILGLACSLIGWLVTTKVKYGIINVDTSGKNIPMLVGNVVALLSPCVFIPLFTLIFGMDNYDYETMRAIRKADDHDLAAEAHVQPELIPGESRAEDEAEEQRKLTRAAFIARLTTVVMTLIFLVLWPFPIFGTSYIFSKRFFTGWVSVSIAWLFFSSFIVGIFPIWEGRHSIAHTAKSLWRDLTGRKTATLQGTGGDVMVGSEGGSTTEKELVQGKA
ncbi:Sodium:solute symporter family-domain-containing protein [Kalaharituber pfeilii]|nr:Sodium:solute symporter family-domain-containing protein [Kalaharituber pfeilii]